MAIKQQTIVITVTFYEEGTHANSALEVIGDALLNDTGIIEYEYSVEKEETLPYDMFIDDDLED
ncbi:hypothetical protein [Peribacillus frigoritolerans]|uniref:hypothetical protein n=1 Tax=Peribacillus frigoritolerans TaxID=450367 RepID=UPI002EB1C7DE|nr:hypothetical protein [Peribacillus frigoritolerans]